MKKSDLKVLIESIIKEISSEEDMVSLLNDTQLLTEKLDSVISQNKTILDSINKIKKERDDSFKRLEKAMIVAEKTEIKSKNWLAQVKEELKYKVAKNEYKGLWESALNKLNEATRNILVALQEEQLELKRLEKEKVLSITSINENKTTDSITSILDYSAVVSDLPEI